MEHRDHVALLRSGVERPPGAAARWADIGAGTGAFTLALADLLGSGASIFALDRDAEALRRNAAAMARAFPAIELTTVIADLEAPPPILAALDGIVAANSLHFVPPERQVAAIARLAAALRPGGTFMVVEYDADRGNPWVPHPFSVARWPRLALDAGLVDAQGIARVPSRFLGAIYAAVAYRA